MMLERDCTAAPQLSCHSSSSRMAENQGQLYSESIRNIVICRVNHFDWCRPKCAASTPPISSGGSFSGVVSCWTSSCLAPALCKRAFGRILTFPFLFFLTLKNTFLVAAWWIVGTPPVFSSHLLVSMRCQNLNSTAALLLRRTTSAEYQGDGKKCLMRVGKERKNKTEKLGVHVRRSIIC